jgi:hypothetical protein
MDWGSRKTWNLVFSVVVVFIIGWMLWEARDWSFRARLFPWTIGWPALGLAIFQVFLAARSLREPTVVGPEVVELEPAATTVAYPGQSDASVISTAMEAAFGSDSPPAKEEELPVALVRRRAIEMSLWILAFTFGVVMIGFKFGPALATLAFLRFAARESWVMSISIALGIYLFFLLIFEIGLNIRLPAGWIPDTLDYEPLDQPLVDFLSGLLRAAR